MTEPNAGGSGPPPPSTPAAADRRKRKKDGLMVEPAPEGDLMQTPARSRPTAKSPWWNAFLEESPGCRIAPSPMNPRFSPARTSPGRRSPMLTRVQSPARHAVLFPASPGNRLWDSATTPAMMRTTSPRNGAVGVPGLDTPVDVVPPAGPVAENGSSPATRARRSNAFTFQRSNFTVSVRESLGRTSLDTPSRPAFVQRLLFSPGQGRSLAHTPSSVLDAPFTPVSPMRPFPMDAATSLTALRESGSPAVLSSRHVQELPYMSRPMTGVPPPPPPDSESDLEDEKASADMDADEDDEADDDLDHHAGHKHGRRGENGHSHGDDDSYSDEAPVRSSGRRKPKRRRLSMDSGGSPLPAPPRASSGSDVVPTHVSGMAAAEQMMRSPMEARRPKQKKPGAKAELKRCNCKKSKCLKLYCECFQRQGYCKDCNCVGCSNTPEHEDVRQKAIAATLERDPHAFFRCASPRSQAQAPAAVIAAAAASKPGAHPKGCNCKKSQCLKKYCECYQAGLSCGDNCKCLDCKNGGAQQDLSPNSRKKKKAKLSTPGSGKPVGLGHPHLHPNHVLPSPSSAIISPAAHMLTPVAPAK